MQSHLGVDFIRLNISLKSQIVEHQSSFWFPAHSQQQDVIIHERKSRQPKQKGEELRQLQAQKKFTTKTN